MRVLRRGHRRFIFPVVLFESPELVRVSFFSPSFLPSNVNFTWLDDNTMPAFLLCFLVEACERSWSFPPVMIIHIAIAHNTINFISFLIQNTPVSQTVFIRVFYIQLFWIKFSILRHFCSLKTIHSAKMHKFCSKSVTYTKVQSTYIWSTVGSFPK